jgi:hypothetical protein
MHNKNILLILGETQFLAPLLSLYQHTKLVFGMIRTLLLLFALLLVSGVEPTEAARPTAYARAKMKGRMYTHRPSYKIYKGHRNRGKRSLFGARKRSHSKVKRTPTRASRI